MKTKSLIGIILIGIAIAIVISMTSNASSYVSFEEAKTLSEKGLKKSLHVVGNLLESGSKERKKRGGIEESPDKLSFKFWMTDEKGVNQQVHYAHPVPADFTKSEKVVVVGQYKESRFIADKILLKCPSKYQESPNF